MEVGAFSYQFKEGGAYCFHHKRLEAAECGSVVSTGLLNVIRQVIEEVQSGELLQLANRERQPVDALTLSVVSVFGEEGNASYVLPFFIRSAIQ